MTAGLTADLDDPAVAQARGVEHFLAGRHAQALADFDRVIAVDPAFPPAHHNRGLALDRMSRLAEALAAYDAAIALDADYARAHDSRGATLRKLGRPEAALESHTRALTLAGDVAEAHANRAAALYELGRPGEALAAAERAIGLKPDLADAHFNRGAALYRLNRPAEAVTAYETAVAFDPDHAHAVFGAAMARLLLGDMAGGWRAYEYRKAALGDPAAGLDPAEAWRGEPLSGARLLVLAEQGLGDALQFARFIPRLKALGAEVTLRVPAALTSLLARSLEGVSVEAETGLLPAHERHCALLSLPYLLDLGGDVAPSAADWLRPDPVKARRWRERLGPARRRRIGLVWRGAAHHPDDRNRSIAPQRLAPLLSLDADFICLQDRLRPDDRAVAQDLGLLHPGRALTDLDETAALASLMDAVVSVDTSLAHLAGSLGLPTRILLPFSPDWRWGQAGGTTPWYPTARLFRQPAAGDWESVVAAVRRDIEG